MGNYGNYYVHHLTRDVSYGKLLSAYELIIESCDEALSKVVFKD